MTAPQQMIIKLQHLLGARCGGWGYFIDDMSIATINFTFVSFRFIKNVSAIKKK